jgi:hypothetical protein
MSRKWCRVNVGGKKEIAKRREKERQMEEQYACNEVEREYSRLRWAGDTQRRKGKEGEKRRNWKGWTAAKLLVLHSPWDVVVVLQSGGGGLRLVQEGDEASRGQH